MMIPPMEDLGGWAEGWGLWNGLAAEVERELQERVLLVGPYGAGKSTLLNRMKGWPISPVDQPPSPQGRLESYGLFTLVDLPEEEEPGESLGMSPEALPGAFVLFVVDGTREPSSTIYSWLVRFRQGARPIRLALNHADRMGGDREAIRRKWERTLGVPAILLSARSDPNLPERMVRLMLQANPRLAVALGREFQAFRGYALREMIRSAAFHAALANSLSAPLLDFPAQAIILLRLIARIAAMHDRLPMGGLGREEVLMVLTALGLRYGMQWLARRLPLVGRWSAGWIGAAGTWAIGYAADRYFAWAAASSRARIHVHWDGWGG